MGGAIVLRRGRRRESGAENDCNGNCKFCLAQHFFSWMSVATLSTRLKPTLGETVNAVVKLS
jgi:hypothetical protein